MPQPEVAPAAPPRTSMTLTSPMSGMLFQPRSFGELLEFCKMVAASGMTPPDYVGNPGAVLVAIQMGAELGLGPMAALQNIAVINGRPSVWGDAGLAIVKTHPSFVSIKEDIRDDGTTVTLARRGEPDVTRSFTIADAREANLWDKKGTWQNYPKRMMQMRARWWAMRDQFPDALRGIHSAEESHDIERAQAGVATIVQHPSSLNDVVKNAKPALVAAPQAAAQAPAVAVEPAPEKAPATRTLDDVVKTNNQPAPARRDDEPPHPAESKARF
jgi:ribosomal protein L12E/L44/L45/RPP1/RPP2